VLGGCEANLPDARETSDTPTLVPPHEDLDQQKLLEEKHVLLEFTYSLPREAANIPSLARTLRQEAQTENRRAWSDVPAARISEWRENPGVPIGAPNQFHKAWKLLGQNARLLSLMGYTHFYHFPGPHGLDTFEAFVWDKQSARRVDLTLLFKRHAAAISGIQSQYCSLFTAMRKSECPSLGELTVAPYDRDGNGRFDTGPLPVAPYDRNGNGRFDTWAILINAYDAGGYASGPAEVLVPITEEVHSMLLDEYAPLFEKGAAVK